MVENDVLRLTGWTDQQARFIDFCLSEGHLPQAAYERIVEERVEQIGRQMLQDATKGYADHVASPHALAYLLQRKRLAPKLVNKIRFDHSDTAETFYHNQVDDLIERVCTQLRQCAVSLPGSREEAQLFLPI
jgi:hypothetical protein